MTSEEYFLNAYTGGAFEANHGKDSADSPDVLSPRPTMTTNSMGNQAVHAHIDHDRRTALGLVVIRTAPDRKSAGYCGNPPAPWGPSQFHK